MAEEKELTKKMAFWLTYRLWTWMAETGSDSETHWPEWEKWEEKYKEGTTIRYNPLCKFYLDRQVDVFDHEEKRKRACTECANDCDSIWKSEPGLHTGHCTDSDDSIYFEWVLAFDDEELRNKYAKEMANKFYEIYLSLAKNHPY